MAKTRNSATAKTNAKKNSNRKLIDYKAVKNKHYTDGVALIHQLLVRSPLLQQVEDTGNLYTIFEGLAEYTDEKQIKSEVDQLFDSENEVANNFIERQTYKLYCVVVYGLLQDDASKDKYRKLLFGDDTELIREFEAIIAAYRADNISNLDSVINYFSYDYLLESICLYNQILADKIIGLILDKHSSTKEALLKKKNQLPTKRAEMAVGMEVGNSLFFDIYMHLCSVKISLQHKSCFIPGWDDPYVLNGLLETPWEDDALNNLFIKIKGRTRTRYSYERMHDFNQGPHTVARVFGFNARRLYVREITGPGKKKTGKDKVYRFKTAIDYRDFDDFFRHLITSARAVERSHIVINKRSFSYQSSTVAQDTLYDTTTHIKKEKADGIFVLYPLINYWDHLDETIRLYQEAYDAGRWLKMLLYGQILSDLHPFATSFNIDAGHKQTAGGGEGMTMMKIKWIRRLQNRNNEKNANIFSKKIHGVPNEQTKTALINALQENDPATAEQLKVSMALDFILPGSCQNKGLIDKGDFNLIKKKHERPFLDFVCGSITANLRMMGYTLTTSAANEVKRRVNEFYNTKT